jgi:hypothetical protein
VTNAQDNANEASSRGGNSRADMFETRDFYLACYLRCAGYELRPPRVERGFVRLLLYEPKVEEIRNNAKCMKPRIPETPKLSYVRRKEQEH